LEKRTVLSIDIPSTAHSHCDTSLLTTLLSAEMEHLCTPIRRYEDRYALVVVYRWDWKYLRAFLTGVVTPIILCITENAVLVDEDGLKAFDLDASMPHSAIAADIEEASAQEPTLLSSRNGSHR
jgi:hypothetical protein